MTKITENELKNKVSRLREYLAVVEATAPGMGQKGPTVAAAQGVDPSNPLNKSTANAGLDASGRKTATTDPRVGQTTSATTQSTKPAPMAKPAGPPKVAYEKDFPEETAKELQTKLNAVGEKLTVDGKMGPATRAAMARHPEITSNPNAPAAPAGDGSAPVTPQVAPQQSAMNQTPAPQTSMSTDDEAGAHAFDPTWGGTVATGGQTTAPNANATWDNTKQAAVPNPTATAATPATAQSTKPPAPNPYADNPAQAAIYAAMSPADQAWATKGGGKPDLTDKYIAMRAPNGFKPVAPVQETTSYDELSRLVSLVHHR